MSEATDRIRQEILDKEKKIVECRNSIKALKADIKHLHAELEQAEKDELFLKYEAFWNEHHQETEEESEADVETEVQLVPEQKPSGFPPFS